MYLRGFNDEQIQVSKAKIVTYLFTVASFIFFLNTSYAKSSDGAKFAVVDMQVVEAKSDAVGDLGDKLNAEQSRLRQVINDKSKDLQKRARELETKRGVLSASAIEEKRKALENELIVLQSDAQIKGDNLQNAKNEILLEIDSKIREIATKIGKSKDVSYVSPKQIFLYLSEDIATDITDLVVKELNSSYKTIDLRKHLSSKNSSGAK